MANVSHRFVLLFYSDIGKSLRISIPRARMDKNAAEVQASMDAIIANGAVMSSRGELASVQSAKTVSTERRTVV
ncbi:MAG: DUF2922 domain-containing protein [Defluviitaleaceae bacterium]|nr:DUF2922 domain-containing protein [Defluviitaleaceae bacterium]